MGRYTSLVRITGSFNDATLCKDGTARMKTSITKRKWKRSPKFRNSRDSAALFGGASACAGALFKNLSEEMRQQARPHATNHMANGMRALQRQRNSIPERYTFEEAIGALHRLDLSKDKTIAHLVQVKTIGHPLQPNGIHITGLKEAAETITERCKLAKAGQQLQMRLHFGFAAFQELKFDSSDRRWIRKNDACINDQPSTAWLPAECIPAEGLPMALQNPNDTRSQVLFVAIEWRQVPAGERTKTWNHKAPTQNATPTQGKNSPKRQSPKRQNSRSPRSHPKGKQNAQPPQFSIRHSQSQGLRIVQNSRPLPRASANGAPRASIHAGHRHPPFPHPPKQTQAEPPANVRNPQVPHQLAAAPKAAASNPPAQFHHIRPRPAPQAPQPSTRPRTAKASSNK